jgi:hypothetical protein
MCFYSAVATSGLTPGLASRTLSQNFNGRANFVLDTFLSRRRTTSEQTLGPTSHSLSLSLSLSQNVNRRLETFLSRRRTTSASASGPTSRTLSQNVNGRAHFTLDAFLSRRHTNIRPVSHTLSQNFERSLKFYTRYVSYRAVARHQRQRRHYRKTSMSAQIW